jgi:hypothetical protein
MLHALCDQREKLLSGNRKEEDLLRDADVNWGTNRYGVKEVAWDKIDLMYVVCDRIY